MGVVRRSGECIAFERRRMFLRIPGSRGSPTKSAETVEHRPTNIAETVERPTNIAQTVEHRPTKSVKTVEQLAKARASARAVTFNSPSGLRKRANPVKIAKTVEHGTNGLNSPEIIETRRLMSRNLY